MIDPLQLREIWNAHSDRVTLIARAMADPADSQEAEDAVLDQLFEIDRLMDTNYDLQLEGR